jgi:MFS transporter, FSR family, fosmidomycin resistance protein
MNKIHEVLGLSFAHLINDIYAPVLMAIQPVLIATLGYSYFEAALLPAMHSIISSLLQPAFGYLSDRRGLKIRVSVSILLSGSGVAALGILQDRFMMMILCVAISAVGHASFHPGALCNVNAISSSGNRGRLTSLFVVGGNLGFALGPILAGVVLASGGIPSLTWLIIPAIAGALIIHIRKESQECVHTQKPDNFGEENWRPVILLFTGSSLRSWVTFGSMTFLPTFLVLEGYPLLTATTMVTLMLLAGVTGQISGGIMSDRVGRKTVVVVTTLAAVPAFAAILVTTGAWLMISLMVFGFFLWSSFAVTIAMSHELMPSRVGLISGLFLGVAMGAGGIGVSISGIIADHAGLPATLAIFPIITLLAALVFLLVKTPKRII